MKRVFTLLWMLSLILGLAAETISIGNGKNFVNLVSSNGSETVLEFGIGSYEQIPVELEGEQWHRISLPKEGVTLQEGFPELPVLNRSIIIPDQALMKFQLYDLVYQDVPLAVLPSKGNLLRSVDPERIAFRFGEVYNQDAFYPAEPVDLSEPYTLSDLRGITVRTSPFAYNPVSRTLRIYSSYKIRIYTDGYDTVNTITSQRTELSRAFVQVYEQHFLNWNAGRYTSVNDSFGKMLVISHSSLISSLSTWLEWKRQKGIETELIDFSTIGTTAVQLLTYIQNRYTADTQIKYIQLVGDAAQIPSLSYYGGAADPAFALVAGSDNYPDLFIGRFSATNADELTPQLNKSIYYERDAPTSASWLAKATGVASSLGPGDNDEYDYEHLDVIRTKLLSYGYTTVDQIYAPSATAAQVSTAINQGRGFLNYTGHGSQTSWGTTGFSNTNVNALTNGDMAPVIVTVACLNGDFVDYTCFAEAWLRKSGGGAVSVYASSISQSWDPPMRAQDEIVDLMVANTKFTVGGLFFNGSCKMIDVYGSNGSDMFKTWTIFGDASLLMRSKTPQTMSVTYPASAFTTSPFIVNTGVANALVGLSLDGVRYASAYTNSSGVASVNLPASTGSLYSMNVTVTAPNKVTYVGTVLINFGGITWTGNTSTNWNTGSNWSSGVVPISTTDVFIPASTPYSPTSSNAIMRCHDLYIASGAYLTVNSYDLYVYNDLFCNGLITINSISGDIIVSRDVLWQDGSQVSSTNSGADLFCGRNMVFLEGSNVNFSLGTISFNGTANSYLENHSAATQINNLTSNVSSSAYLTFSSSSTQDILIKGNFTNSSTAVSYNYYAGNISIRGNLVSQNSASGGLRWYYGTVIMDGSNQQITLPHSTEYLNNLVFSQTGTCTLNSNLMLKGNLSIESGVFNANAYNITLGGNWSNLVGPTAFTEGTGKVTFSGISHQYCNYTENFNLLEVNKSSGALRINSSSAVLTCAQYDWTAGSVDILTGTFTANYLVDNGIFGNYYVNPGGTINLNNYTRWVDLNGSLTFTNGGTINIYGGATASYWPYAGNASITMNGGTLNFKDQGVLIVSSSTYSLTTNITGGTIKMAGNLEITRTDFNPTGGTMEFCGSADASISLAVGSTLHSLSINKSAATREEAFDQPEYNTDHLGVRTPITRSNTVTTSNNLILNGNMYIQAGIFVAPAQMTVKGNWTNDSGSAAFTEGTGLVIFSGSGNSSCAGDTFSSLELSKTGSGKLIVPSGILSCASYNWTSGTIQVSGGTFTANDLFDNNIKGAYILSSGTINLTQDSGFFVDLNADLNISGGTMNVLGGMSNVASEWAYTNAITITMSGGVLDFKNQGILLSATVYALTLNLTGGTVRTTGAFTIERPGVLLPGGTVELYGSSDTSPSHISGCSFYNLTVNKAVTREGDRERINRVSLNATTLVSNDLTVSSGTLLVGAVTVTVSRDLIVNGKLEMSSASALINVSRDISFGATSLSNVTAGTLKLGRNLHVTSGSAIQLGTNSTVEFIGADVSRVYAYSSTASFGNISSSKTDQFIDVSATANILNISGNLVTPAGKSIVFYNGTTNIGGTWTHGGSCTVENVTTVNINTLQLNGSLQLRNGSVNVSNTFAQASGSNLTLSGGSLYLNRAYSAAYYNSFAGTVNLNSGTLQISNNGFALAASSQFNFNGGFFKLGGSFRALTGVFHPTLGIVEFIGTSVSSIECGGGNYFYDLLINKSNASNQVTMANSITINHNLLVQRGQLSLSSYTLQTNGALSIDVDGKLLLPPDSRLEMGSGSSLSVLSGGEFYALGSAGHPSTLTSPSGYYDFTAFSNSTLGAEYCVFEKMNASGIKINLDAIVDTGYSFHHCTFQYGATGGTLLRKDNAQVLTVNGAIFPTNSWGSSHNVYHGMAGSGTITFVGATGGFAGAGFEDDANNRIFWGNSGAGGPQNVQISLQGGLPRIAWNASSGASLYYIYRSANPYSANWGTPVGNTSGLFWIDSSAGAGTRFFYRVTAVD